MQIKYGTLTDYAYFIQKYESLVKQKNSFALARFIAENPENLRTLRDFQQKILKSGALDPANPATKNLVGSDLYETATQNGILFYPKDIKYIHNIIRNDNIYRILPKNNQLDILYGNNYMIEKLIVNYEYFLGNTNPPQSTRRAIICAVGDLVNLAAPEDVHKFHRQLNFDRPFIERWFEKIR